ncbi:hypothetical protein C5167_016551 [Papaver somniferum]|uniref:uncharacterized protein LOC113345503 n=1 Tax=Papaver somniferum TaxID=3469 RepID=UPI000E6FE769|nr:uncharacterized protein LOC113345503 [Papaver somniferum]RZC93856.1 hypothetical protein C5167_016551 [Papaver somniferum]
MANKLRGFARMLTNAKNSTRKEGFSRTFSSFAEKSTEKQGDVGLDKIKLAQRTKAINREVDIEMIQLLSASVAGGVVLGCLYSYFLRGWNPFEDTPGRDKDYGNHALQVQPKFKR